MQYSNLIDNGVPKSIQRILIVCRSDCVDKKEDRVAKPLPCTLDTQTGVLSCLARCCLNTLLYTAAPFSRSSDADGQRLRDFSQLTGRIGRISRQGLGIVLAIIA